MITLQWPKKIAFQFEIFSYMYWDWHHWMDHKKQMFTLKTSQTAKVHRKQTIFSFKVSLKLICFFLFQSKLPSSHLYSINFNCKHGKYICSLFEVVRWQESFSNELIQRYSAINTNHISIKLNNNHSEMCILFMKILFNSIQ